MKTIAATAVFLTLATSAWAGEPAKIQPNSPAAANAPIELSEAEMDAVTAGAVVVVASGGDRTFKWSDNNSPLPKSASSDGVIIVGVIDTDIWPE